MQTISVMLLFNRQILFNSHVIVYFYQALAAMVDNSGGIQAKAVAAERSIP